MVRRCSFMSHPVYILILSRPFSNNNQGSLRGRPLGSQLGLQRPGAAGTLFALPPMATRKQEERFRPGVFTVVDPDSPRLLRERLPSVGFEGKVVRYGDPFVLVDSDGRTWSNRTSVRTGYIGPRRPRRRGEMFMVFSKRQDAEGGAAGALRSSSSNRSNRSIGGDDPENRVVFGDSAWVDVVTSNRHRSRYNKRVSNYKKKRKNLAGGYLCSDGQGTPLLFNIRRYLSSGRSAQNLTRLAADAAPSDNDQRLYGSVRSSLATEDEREWHSSGSEGESEEELDDEDDAEDEGDGEKKGEGEGSVLH